MKTIRYALRLCALIVLTASGLAAAPAATVQSEKDSIVFRLSLEKTQFIEGEPIIAKCTLVNNSASSRVLVEPSVAYRFALVGVRQTSGTAKPSKRDGHGDYGGPPDGYGWEFKPGDAHSDCEDLQAPYTRPLPVGRYTAHALYRVDDARGALDQHVWQGEIKTPELEFSVVEPAADEKTEASQFVEARYHPDRVADAVRAAATLNGLSCGAREGVFARYAGYWEANSYSSAQDKANGEAALRRYVAAYSDTPYYGEMAVNRLAFILLHRGDYREAYELFSKLPEGFVRKILLKQCEDGLRAAPPSN